MRTTGLSVTQYQQLNCLLGLSLNSVQEIFTKRSKAGISLVKIGTLAVTLSLRV
jgi:hypothetical protein